MFTRPSSLSGIYKKERSLRIPRILYKNGKEVCFGIEKSLKKKKKLNIWLEEVHTGESKLVGLRFP